MDHATLFFLKISRILSKVNASALTPGLRFHDEGFEKSPLTRFTGVMIDFGGIVGVKEGAREEIILLRKGILHFGKGEGKCIFSRDDAHGGEVINSLRIGHPLKGLVYYPSIAPFDLPVLSLSKIFDLPVETFTSANFLEDGVLGICVM